MLAEINQPPRIFSEVDAALKAKQMKGDVDEYLKVPDLWMAVQPGFAFSHLVFIMIILAFVYVDKTSGISILVGSKAEIASAAK